MGVRVKTQATLAGAHLPPDIPPIVIAQHIPPVFSTAFAKRMSDLCPFEVKEAETGDELRAGRVLIAPGGLQMSVQSRRNSPLRVLIEQSTPEDRYKPSIDRLFESLAPIAGKQTIGVILTGMGTDGAKGLLSLRNAGARTIAQDEASCVVYGMPKEAVKVGAVEKVSSLTQIANHLVQYLRKKAAA